MGLCIDCTPFLKELVTKWCVENQKVPDTQFGFYPPDCSTTQAMFMALSPRCQTDKLKGLSHLHTAFIDYKQAYDTIDRPHLWNHLNNIRMPTHLIKNVIGQMYDGDKYVLIDATKTASTSNSAVPLRGVTQDCPLPPLLFSLFINDVDDEFGSGFVSAATGTEGFKVTHMLHAGNLTLTASNPVQ